MIIDIIEVGIVDFPESLCKFLVDSGKAFYFDENTCKRIKEGETVKDDARDTADSSPDEMPGVSPKSHHKANKAV